MLVFVVLPAASSHLEVHPVNNKTLFCMESASIGHGRVQQAPAITTVSKLRVRPSDHMGGQLPAGVGAEGAQEHPGWLAQGVVLKQQQIESTARCNGVVSCS